ncbi:MAG TPA: hydrogenase formation protein HypD [Phycisphaerae bacterium]|nr:hydrogenase formation protein HypD [Phycisphaerae bacterium]HOJ73792.1 hydrogenase formation protein HypD [Phycisphaerae bacterium]HOM50439.1 hydrogenase formation protein HypD [Phycisphaerae bacterium]HON65432.1 hydrogenase formation protein HypD [Phycisphaerae bacterium]HOQ85705.1 hydrogenase formation protein HypD [Phycisphaerae bacterium]
METKTSIPLLVDRIGQTMSAIGRRLQIMEICGTHTVSLFRTGVKSLLPESLKLVSGPGCPVCVTSQGYIDAACELASRPDVTICTYGDMVRVPGRTGSLERQRASGASVVVIYSARDAVRFAAEHPDRQVVMLGVGFETTAPATAAAVLEAEAKGLTNFTVLPGHKLVIPAMAALLSAGDVPIDGFLCPGHVSIVIGAKAYQPIVDVHRRPCVVAGFEPENMLLGILHIVEQISRSEARLENVYPVAVTHEGNAVARQWLDRVFEPGPTVWRAMGTIADSGLVLRDVYRRYDALERFGLTIGADYDPPGCRCGEVIQGKVEPVECTLFGRACTPTRPVGPCMVSSEGTCAAWFKYGGLGARG